MAEIGVHHLSRDRAGGWTEHEIDDAWRAVLELWPGDDARAARTISLAIAAGLSPDEFHAHLEASR